MQCPKCEGLGTIERYRHIYNGQCYECNGTGTVPDDAPIKTVKWTMPIYDHGWTYAWVEGSREVTRHTAEGSVVIPAEKFPDGCDIRQTLLKVTDGPKWALGTEHYDHKTGQRWIVIVDREKHGYKPG